MSWVVIAEAGRNKRGQRYVAAVCSCGTERRVLFDNIRSGKSTSCGCLSRKSEHSRSNGGKPTPTYVSWQSMRTRCLNPKSSDYPNYGGRGITITPDWDSYEKFLADMGERPVGTTLDRIDVLGSYEPGNCRWASAKLQRANQRPHKRSVKICPVS